MHGSHVRVLAEQYDFDALQVIWAIHSTQRSYIGESVWLSQNSRDESFAIQVSQTVLDPPHPVAVPELHPLHAWSVQIGLLGTVHWLLVSHSCAVPAIGAVAGPPGEAVKVRAALLVLEVSSAGLNVMTIEQVDPAARAAPEQVSAFLTKSAAFEPVSAAVTVPVAAAPVFRIVKPTDSPVRPPVVVVGKM